MRKVHIDSLQPGARLAKAVFTPEGRILLTSGVELKEKFIEKLRVNNITELYIDEDVHFSDVHDAVCEQTRNEAQHLVKTLMSNYSFTNSLDIERIKEVANKIVAELLESNDILIILSDIKSVDDYTFEHSVNVCILSLVIGISLGFNINNMKDLGIGALLHDIGKLKIPEEILKKPSQLTFEEFEEIKKHTIYGYEILKNSGKVGIASAYIAFGHHERYDGSGYPLQLNGESIHQYARIVAVADVYDALTSDRVYRKKLRSHEVVEYVTSIATHHFDRKVVLSFIKHIMLYPVGSGVVLNTKARAQVVRVNHNLPTRPVIRIIYDEHNVKLFDECEIDLVNKRNIHIVGTCEI